MTVCQRVKAGKNGQWNITWESPQAPSSPSHHTMKGSTQTLCSPSDHVVTTSWKGAHRHHLHRVTMWTPCHERGPQTPSSLSDHVDVSPWKGYSGEHSSAFLLWNSEQKSQLQSYPKKRSHEIKQKVITQHSFQGEYWKQIHSRLDSGADRGH